MLRHHAEPHPRHAFGHARHRRPGARSRGGATPTVSTETPPAPLGQRSRIGSLVEQGGFITLVEIVPPKGIDCCKEIEGARLLAQLGVHAINVPDSPRASARMSAQSLCIQIQQHTGIETILHYTCRDRNVLSIQSDLLGASSIGLRNILCLTGDPPKLGNYPDATAVFDVDAIGLVNIVRRLNHGLDIGSNSIGASPTSPSASPPTPAYPISNTNCDALPTRSRRAQNTPLRSQSSTFACLRNFSSASRRSEFRSSRASGR